ncbi:MAG: C69 family dipeptidase [Bacteroidales bacterium]|jgi:dipeptidase|nr:C69 family dipeptidase [Bacteroidales bacterium]MBQ4478754.1 C69 family dipeptidase [Bacteroidales bacterium]MBR4454366.1 C69 family dipeptidase [Bacteroidales bacterium]MCR5554026.1 C69 family dipeptidase [Bacteroidales bacterium]
MKKNFVSLAVATALVFATSAAMACTNFLVTKGASTDGSTFISYAADSHTLYGELYYRKAATYPAGTMFTVYDWDSGKKLGEIPQVAKTYSVVGNMNECQLAIGETTYGGLEDLYKPNGIIDYGSLIYLTLQRASNAREAIKTMAELLATYGYASEGESFSIADPNEVWVMDLIGKGEKINNKKWTKGAVWVARRVPDGYICAHANQARITTFPMEKQSKNSISSKNLKRIFEKDIDVVYAYDVVEFARMKGLYSGKDEDFSFCETYNPLTFGGARGCEARVYAFFHRAADNMQQYEDYAMGHNLKNRMPLWVKPSKKISVLDMMSFMRDHYEGTAMDMTKDLGAGPYKCPYRWRPMGWEIDGKTYVHERATSTQQTGFSFIAQCRSWLPNKVGGILWFGVDDTYSTVYCPMYCGITQIPLYFQEGNGNMVTYSPTSAFWLFNQVANFVYSRYDAMIVDLQKVQSTLETGYVKSVADNDAKVKNLSGDQLTAALNKYSNEQADNMFTAWTNLSHYLLVKYMDGNIKKEKDGRFMESEDRPGQNVFPDQPRYPDWWYRKIVEDHGDVLIQK